MVKSGIIYKIRDRIDNQLVYYGSTEKSLSERLDGHLYNYKYWKDGNSPFITSFLVFDADNYDIMMVETVEFDDIKDLWDRERFYIENNICVNNNIPNRTHAEWREANREKLLEYQVEYYKANKEKIAEYNAEYKKVNKVEISQYRKANKAKFNEKVVCVCGGSYTYINKSHHEKTQKHQSYLTSIKCDKK